ncbi:MAG: chemotaxis protein CheA [Vicinamibacterales bacterium]|nr:chemotaxis protein CheA [Vicinamibacterales bacterium]
MTDTLIQDIDARLARAAVDVVVSNDAQALDDLRTALEGLAVVLEAAGLPGLEELAGIVRRASAIATKSDLLTTVQIVDAAWTEWKTALEVQDVGRASGPVDAPMPALPALDLAAPEGAGHTVEADVEALRMDPELSGMFIAEALDHLSSIEATVLELESHPTDSKLLNDVFRPFHTVKGNSGALGVQTVQELAHKVENLLDLCRSGAHQVGPAEIDVILKSVDVLTALITDIGNRLAGEPGQDLEPDRQQLMHHVDQVAAGGGAPAAADTAIVAEAAMAAGATGAVTPEPAARASQRRQDDASVKVDTRKLDNLVDMVGELVIVQSIIYEDPELQRVADERLTRNLAQLRRITGELQRNAMSMRMVPIKQTFQKMARLVRDLGKKSGKMVDLVLEGEETELDRKVVEEINDPLMHMVRNSCDHGIEDAETRVGAGKRAEGRLTLSAYHESGNIVIEIADDGGGLNTEKILRKAVERGLVAPDADLSPAEIHQLIFRPGFSTADQITEISGRGVGMDVVRRNIDALRGRIDIQSTPGQGSVFSIKLPLTLAIVDGLLLRVGEERFVLPTFSVRESLRPRQEHVHTVHGQPCMVQVREHLIPLVRLDELLGIGRADIAHAWEGTVVVVDDDGRLAAVLVDELLGKQEVVIKSLGDQFKEVRGVAGGAILGDGRIGLILDGGSIVTLTRGGMSRAA